MRTTKPALGLALISLLGCAHAVGDRSAPEAERVPTVEQTKRPVRVLVTGSRIPYYVEPGSDELPTYAPVRVYTRGALNATGRDANLGEALRALDPSATIHR